MTAGDAFIGAVHPGGRVEVQDYYSVGFEQPKLDSDLGGQESIVKSSISGRVNATHTVISFTRLQRTGDTRDHDLTATSLPVSFAYSAQGDTALTYHGSHRGFGTIDFEHGTAARAQSAVVIVHAIAMLLGMGVLMPAGVWVARRQQMKARVGTGFFRGGAKGGDDAAASGATAFKWHRALLVSASLLTLGAGVLVLVGGSRRFDGGHSFVGLLVLAAVVAQVLLGALWHGDGAHAAHRRLGAAIVFVVMFLQIPMGFILAAWGPVALLLWGIFVTIHLLAWLHTAVQAALENVPQSEQKGNAFTKFSLGLDLLIRQQFESLGSFVATWRKTVLAVAALFVILCLLGFSRMEVGVVAGWGQAVAVREVLLLTLVCLCVMVVAT